MGRRAHFQIEITKRMSAALEDLRLAEEALLESLQRQETGSASPPASVWPRPQRTGQDDGAPRQSAGPREEGRPRRGGTGE